MPKLLAIATWLLPRRLRPRTRRGSILIMVVAVLVMLALMGTAFISVARIDRTTAVPLNEATAEEVIDSLVPAVNSMAEQTILNDISTPGYRAMPVVGAPNNYDHWDCPISNFHIIDPTAAAPGYGIAALVPANDAWLSPRLPDLVKNPDGSLILDGNSLPIISWRTIGRPINQQNPVVDNKEELFRSPYRGPNPGPAAPPFNVMYGTNGDVQWTMDALSNRVSPTQITVSYPTGYSDASLAGKTRVFPALALTNLVGNVLMDGGAPAQPVKYLAADADGDGIADAGLAWIANVDGVDYYFATRIIDHGSAVNINTAWSMQGEYTFTGPGITAPITTPTAPLAYTPFVFPSSVGLLELLNTFNSGTNQATEFQEINRYRNAYTLPNPPFLPAPTSVEPPPFPAEVHPVEDDRTNPVVNPAQRNDFDYTTQGDAFYHAMTMRMSAPGYRHEGALPANSPTAMGNARQQRPFDVSKNADLSYRFCMLNPDGVVDMSGTKYPRSDLEKLLGSQNTGTGVIAGTDSIYQNAPNYMTQVANRYRYLPGDKARYWFEYSFNYDLFDRSSNWSTRLGTDATPAVPVLPRRALLTASSAVSNATVKHLGANNSTPHEAMLPYENKGRWSADYQQNVGYALRDIVVHHSFPGGIAPGITKLYICVQAVSATVTPPETDTTSWQPIAARGPRVAGATYVPGNIVRYETGAAAASLYICFAANPSDDPPTDPNHWMLVPAGTTPPRTSLNTAPFAELFRAFWNVMAPDVNTELSPFDATIAAEVGAASAAAKAAFPAPQGSFNDPYLGNHFQPYGYINGTTGLASPFEPTIAVPPDDPGYHPARMFRSSIRAVPTLAMPYFDADTPRMAPDQMALLRAAIAAVNAEDMRDNDADITAREVMLKAWVTSIEVPVQCVVYGNEPQPFITEVYVNADCVAEGPLGGGNNNVNGYVAIELYNPYPVPIDMTNWVIARVDRSNGIGPDRDSAAAPMGALADFSLPGDFAVTYPLGAVAPVIPAYGYMILENYNSVPAMPTIPGAAGYRPLSMIGLPQQTGPLMPIAGVPEVVTVFVPGLGDGTVSLPFPTGRTVTNHEMVILRPRLSSNVYSYFTAGGSSPGAQPYPSGTEYDERPASPTRLRDMVPVDSFDFTGLMLSGPALGTPATAWHYVRGNASGAGRNFHFVYPGRYDARNTTEAVPRARQAGTQEALFWNVTPAPGDTWAPGAVPGPPGHPQLGPAQAGPSMTFTHVYNETTMMYEPPTPPIIDGNNNAFASYPTSFPIQLSNGNFATTGPLPPITNVACIGHNPILGAAGNLFPFGGFSRTGDVLSVPFIGAYRIVAPTVGPAPGALLEINPVTMDAAMAEDTNTIGDAPVPGTYPGYAVEIEQIGRFCPSWRPNGIKTLFAYDWASDVLDYFTAIQNHHDDFMPNVDPARYPPAVAPRAISNTPGAYANSIQDRNAPMEGLININTASEQVLSALPLVVNADGSVNIVLTGQLARAIVYYRDVDGDGTVGPPFVPHGPFKSLFELNEVVANGTTNGFFNMMGFDFATTEPGDLHGDFTPWDASLLAGPPAQAAEDGVKDDYEERYLNVIRLSNLLTTRSDVFTCYILVQGWKNCGTATPQLVGERRSAFVVDRSRVSESSGSMTTVTIPTR